MKRFTPPQIAEMFGVDTKKVSGWIKSGELKAVNVAKNPRGERPRWRISEQAIKDFEARRTYQPQAKREPKRRMPAIKNFFVEASK